MFPAVLKISQRDVFAALVAMFALLSSSLCGPLWCTPLRTPAVTSVSLSVVVVAIQMDRESVLVYRLNVFNATDFPISPAVPRMVALPMCRLTAHLHRQRNDKAIAGMSW